MRRIALVTIFALGLAGGAPVLATVTDDGIHSYDLAILQTASESLTIARDNVDGLPLNPGLENALRMRIDNVIRSADRGNLVAACDQLTGVISELNDLVQRGILTAEQAAPVLDNLLAAQTALNCPVRTPSPSPTGSPQPSPTESPTPTPSPDITPTPDMTPTPEPVATPTPIPTSTPGPEQEPEPEPKPELKG